MSAPEGPEDDFWEAFFAWAEVESAKVLATGKGLDPEELRLAHAVGVAHPGRIRILEVEEMPVPADPRILEHAPKVGLDPQFLRQAPGMTLGYGILIQRGSHNHSLVAHECRHVYQVEQAGSLRKFLETYIAQISLLGYRSAPLEEDAYSIGPRACNEAVPDPEPAWFLRASGYDASGSIHGMNHTRRVMIHAGGIARAEGFAPWEGQALMHAARWHDIGRTHDGVDYYHGAKSAGKVLALDLHRGLAPQVYEAALAAVTHHSGSEEHGERAMAYLEFFQMGGSGYRRHRVPAEGAMRVFRALKDADALDRVRLGDLDTSYLRFASSLLRVDIAWQLLEEFPEGVS